MKISDFFENYYAYIGQSEAPAIYHRWSGINAVSCALGRNNYLPFGHSRIYPMLYTFLIGEPGARKSTAINIARNLVEQIGFKGVCVGRTSAEKFIMDLEESALLNQSDDSQLFIAADEFVDFIGSGNENFISLLTSLFDAGKLYTHRLKNSKSVCIGNPTVGILGGATHESFARAFPPEIIGGGMLSRMLLVFSEKTSKKISWPKPGDHSRESALVELLSDLRVLYKTELALSGNAHKMLDEIYQRTPEVKDGRFTHYNQRRHTHLLKLCCIMAGIEQATAISGDHVVWANTLLASVEYRYSRALGEFGAARTSALSSKIMNCINMSAAPVTPTELWTYIVEDCDDRQIMGKILQSLLMAKKIVQTEFGFLPAHAKLRKIPHVDYSILTPEERPLLQEDLPDELQ